MSSEVPTPPPTPKTAYQGNSKAAAAKAADAEEPKVVTPKIKKIEGVNVVKVKKPLGQRIAESFGGDDLKTVGKVLFITVLLPGAKDLLMDVIEVGGRRMIFGEGAGRRASGNGFISGGGGTRIRQTNYGSASRTIGSNSVREPALGSREKRQFDFSNLVIADASKADEIIMEMEAAIEEFGVVTVADFFEAIEETGNGFTDRQFGWDAAAFAGAEPKRVRGGWILDIPEPLSIK
jgi:hypothetical protein